MNTNRIIATSLLAITTGGLSLPGWALLDRVEYVDIRKADGIHINDGKIVVEATNGEYNKVTSGNSVNYHMEMKAGCKNYNILKSTDMVFGNPNIGGGIAEYHPYYTVHLFARGQKSIGYTSAEMQVPLSELPFNPVQLCKDMLQTKQNQGVSKLQVMNSDQHLSRNIALSAVASCGPKSNASKRYFEKATTNVAVDIICKASGGVGSIKAKSTPISGANSIGGGYQPLMITQAQITTNKIHDAGYCPSDKQFTVSFKGHGKGYIRYSIVMGGNSVYQSFPISYNSDEGYKQHHFSYTAALDENKTWEKINKEFKRDFSLLIEEKDENAKKFTWSKKGHFTGLSWYYTCKPKPAVPTVNPGFKAPGSTPVIPGQLTPRAQATSPSKPVRKITTTPPGPQPIPQLQLKSPTSEEQPKRVIR
ncbi:hypothetical protein [Sedimenticola thiotaurini]|nr:hypothetical protein [Sedimenticola thiotaurini]